ncbi:MAG: phospholipase D family protein [Candidatus Latescibacterota bacterium]|nr:phospholipase D family protein [Candidatus Latescibacterota bacterium]
MIACSDTKALLTDFSDISACQKVLSAELMTAVIGLDDKKKQHIVAKIVEGKTSFRVVKDAIAHAKIYLLENEGHRRVIVGSANLSDWAFSGKQAEPNYRVRRRRAGMVHQFESSTMKKEIPDWILKKGSRAGTLVLDRKPLEEFMAISFRRRAWWPFPG